MAKFVPDSHVIKIKTQGSQLYVYKFRFYYIKEGRLNAVPLFNVYKSINE